MTQEEISNIYNKLSELGRGDLADQFYANPVQFDFTQLELDPNFTDKYETVADFLEDHAAIKANLWKKYEGKFPSDARFESLQAKYPWLSKEELKGYFDKSNEYKKFYEDERKKEAGKKRRAMEVEGTYVDLANPEETQKRNWGMLKNILTSDYEKQRYINEPETALFGYEAPALGEAPETRAAAIGDLAAGGTAAVADLIPPAWWVGPTIRAGRDWSYNISGSKYAKDAGDIWKGMGADYGINIAARYLPNLRKGERIATKAADPVVAKTLAVSEAEKNYKYSIDYVKKALESSDPRDVIRAVDGLPDGEVKQTLSKYAQPGKDIQYDKIRDELARLEINLNPTIQETNAILSKFGYGNVLGNNAAQFVKDKAIYNLDNLTKAQKVQYYGNLIANRLNRANPGQIMVQTTPNIYGRGVGKVNYTEYTPEEAAATIDRLISSYSLLWNKDKEPAEAKNNPIIKAAWEKWRNQ